jgi:NIPSNAP
MMYEIRNYHFRPDLFDAYKTWAKNEAMPYLGTQMDVLGFWVNGSDTPEVLGEPQDRLGSANVTWILRWRDLAHRNEVWTRVLASPEWIDIFSRVPEGRASYLRIEAKFTDSLI